MSALKSKGWHLERAAELLGRATADQHEEPQWSRDCTQRAICHALIANAITKGEA